MFGTVVDRLPETSDKAGVSMTDALGIGPADIQPFLNNLEAICKELDKFINSQKTSKYRNTFKRLMPSGRGNPRLQGVTDKLNSIKATLNIWVTALSRTLQVTKTLKRPEGSNEPDQSLENIW